MSREINKPLTLFIVMIFLLISDRPQSLSQSAQSDREKQQLNRLTQLQANHLDIITSIERHGEPYSLFALSVAGIGDINLDGYDDIIVGNPYKGAGEALILLGGAEMDSIPDIILRGENDGDGFGEKVASGGDINGDGGPDFIVSAPDFPNRKGKGRAYIYFGGAILDSIPDAIFTGELNYSNLGRASIAVGDVNGDQSDDMLVGAPNYLTITSRGKAYLYFGGALLDSIPDWMNQGDSSRALFAFTQLAIGDVNGDGLADLLINSSPDIGELGKDHLVVTEIFFSGVEMDTLSDLSLTDSSSGNYQNQILLCDDLNLDGADDFVIYMIDRVRVYFGGADIDTTADSYLLPWYGASINRIASAGDVNGDGWLDILAGFYHLYFKTASCGLYLGSQKIDPTVDWTAGGAGVSLDGAGDVNGDGYDDIIVGMYSSPYTSVAWGAAWILAGKADLQDIRSNVRQIEPSAPPDKHILFQNYPNPFNAETTIRYQLPQASAVTLTIYNLLGQQIRRLVNERQLAGNYSIIWDGRDEQGTILASGIYIYRLEAGSFVSSKKLALVR
ncbi:MAG: T9SS type A sorting domain-containing protein [Candidatus Zhuqueibacterota bacterium]